MNNPINQAFITVKRVAVCTDHGTQELDLLVLDTAANDSYFKKLSSFQETVDDLPEDVKGGWEISKSFMDLAVSDFIANEFEQVQEAFIDKGEEPPEFEPTILGYPVLFTNTEEPTCIFHTELGSRVNTFWQ